MYTGHLSSYITTACWFAWIGYWIMMWRREKPVTEQQRSSERIGYTVLLMCAFILALADTGNLPVLGVRVVHYSWLSGGLGAALALVGVGTTIWARRVLADDWSSDVSFKHHQALVTRGPYAVVRHPIYTGLTLMFIGTALVQGTAAASLAIILGLASFVIKLRQEEQLMENHFGADYTKYERRTKRIIPFIY